MYILCGVGLHNFFLFCYLIFLLYLINCAIVAKKGVRRKSRKSISVRRRAAIKSSPSPISIPSPLSPHPERIDICKGGFNVLSIVALV